MSSLLQISWRSITSFFSILCFAITAFSQNNSSINWQQTSGPAGGVINAFAESIVSSGPIIYAATNGGLYSARNNDKAASWKVVAFQGTSVLAVAASSSEIAAITEGSSGKIFYSQNFGQSWQEIPTPEQVFSVVFLPLATIPSATLPIVIGTNRGIYRYENSEWKLLAAPSVFGGAQFGGKISTNSKGHLFVVGIGALWRSTDEGKTWAKIASHFPQQISLAINRSDEMVIGYNCGGVYRSVDNGDTWQNINYDVVPTGESPCIHSVGITKEGTIFCSPFQGGVKKLVSGIAGWNWLPIAEGLPKTVYPNRTVISDALVMFVTTGDGGGGTEIFLSRIEGGTTPALRLNQEKNSWEAIGTTTLLNSNVSQLKIASEGTIYAATEQGIFRSSDKGTSWSNTTTASSSMEIAQDGSVIVGTYNSAFRSSNQGASWTKIASLPSLQGITKHNDGTLIAAAGGNGIFQSNDNGAAWTRIVFDAAKYYSRAFLSSDKKAVFTTILDGLMRSEDGGKTWTNVLPDTTGQAKEVVCSAISPTTGAIIVGTRNNGLYRSTDNGLSWTRIGLESVPKNPLAFYSITDCIINAQGHIIVTTSGNGVYRSTNNGSTWEQLNTGLFNKWTTAVLIAPDGSLFAGTQGSGVFRGTNMATSVNTTSQVGSQISLHVFPNPVSDAATISYTVARRTFVTIDILTSLGQKIATLVSGEREIGTFTVGLPVSLLGNAANGVYFCRVQAGENTSTVPITIQK